MSSGVAGSAAAHGDDAGLVIEPSSVAAGGAVSVRGDLPTTNAIELVLVSVDGSELELLSLPDTGAGHFEATIGVPAIATPGTWTVEARAAGMAPVSARLEIVAADAEPASRNREDVVPVPPRTPAAPAVGPSAPVMVVGLTPGLAAAEGRAADEGGPPALLALPVAAMLLVSAGLGTFLLRQARHRAHARRARR